MQALESIALQDCCAHPIPYRGPLYRVRPLVKWILIAFLVVNVGVSTLVLQEQSLGVALRDAAIPLVVCLSWLIPTRTKNQLGPTPLIITFYPDRLTLDGPHRPVRGRGGQAVFRRRVDTIQYSGIKTLCIHTQYHRLEITGHILCEMYRPGADGQIPSAPNFRKTADGAVIAYLADYNPPEVEAHILEAMERYTGKPIQRFDPANPTKQ